MSDSRFNSVHLEFPRRQRYREQRDAVLAARGILTRTAECALGFVGEAEDWPSLLRAAPERLLPGAAFYLVDEPDEGAYLLKVGLNTIGRKSNNDIVLADRAISRRHCVVVVHARGGCELHDTASLNGTFVNGRRIKDAVQLTSGDEIVLCRRRLMFVSAADLLAAPADASGSATLLR